MVGGRFLRKIHCANIMSERSETNLHCLRGGWLLQEQQTVEGWLFPQYDLELYSWLLVAEARQVGWLLKDVFFTRPNKQRRMITDLICCYLISPPNK